MGTTVSHCAYQLHRFLLIKATIEGFLSSKICYALRHDLGTLATTVRMGDLDPRLHRHAKTKHGMFGVGKLPVVCSLLERDWWSMSGLLSLGFGIWDPRAHSSSAQWDWSCCSFRSARRGHTGISWVMGMEEWLWLGAECVGSWLWLYPDWFSCDA